MPMTLGPPTRKASMSANAQAREKAKPLPVGPPLASQMRAGAHARRLRSEQKAWLARNWRIVAVTFGLGAVGAIAAHALLPAQFAPFVIGAIAASCGWWVYTLMLELGGLANLRSGSPQRNGQLPSCSVFTPKAGELRIT